MRLLSNAKPHCENLVQSQIHLIRSMANMVNLENYTQMTFDECMRFIMTDSRGLVPQRKAQFELILLFEDRGFEIKLVPKGS